MVNNAAGVMFMSPYTGLHATYFVLLMYKNISLNEQSA